MSYAFVFLNAIVGIPIGLLRIAKAMILGLFFFSRPDRPILMPGFQKWEKGKLSGKTSFQMCFIEKWNSSLDF